MIETLLTECPPLSQLESLWKSLEAQAQASFFNSWLWVGSWLECLPAALKPQLLQASLGGNVVGLALLGRRRQRRHGFVVSRSLYLQALGEPGIDVIAVEYNGFLVRGDATAAVTQAMLDHVLQRVPGWDELHLPGIVAPPGNASTVPGMRWKSEPKPFYTVDLKRVRESAGDYLSLLTQRRRYQVRKSEKACGQLGPVDVQVARTPEQALAFLAELKALHQAYWQRRGAPGAFASDFANRFHDRLVRQGLPTQAVQLMRISAGEHVIGYLYNFMHRGRVSNYQSGIHYELLPRSVSPGLVCHARAILHNAHAGQDVYDMMAGDARYKRELATDTGALQWAVLQQDRLAFRIEDAARGLKARIAAWRSKTRRAGFAPSLTEPSSSSH